MASSSSSRHVPTYSADVSSSSTLPLMPANHSLSASSSATHLRPAHSRGNSSQLMSWVAPEDFDPDTMFDAPIPRPRSASGNNTPASHSRTVSFGAASSLLGEGSSLSARAPSPFGLNPREGSTRAISPFGINPENRASTSLSLNYVPSKFSDALFVGGARRRKPKEANAPAMARGGGVDAFRKGEARVADDRDDLHPSAASKGWFDRTEMGSRWTRFKWVLFVFNVAYTVCALAGLVSCILIWLDIIEESDVIRVANHTELVFSTLAASVAVFTCVFGWAGVMLNNRSFLAFYAFFLWFSFAFLVVPGYLTYRRQNLNLQGKLNFAWSEDFDIDARRRIQNALGCCGYFNPYVEASISATCYARSVLPGCKGPYLRFQAALLRKWFIIVFSLAGFHLCVIVASLLCANHVTYRFGKGMMPKAYRLNADAVAVIMDNYASQLAEDYGPDVAAAFVSHSRAASMVDLSDMGTMPMSMSSARSRTPSSPGSQMRYGTIGMTKPETAM